MGGNRGEAKDEDKWAGGVQAGDSAFVAELAIPGKTLADAGMDKARLMLDLSARGLLRQAPKTGKGFERVILASKDMAQPRPLSLRLHFAEIEDVKPGERVFDVKVQGKTVLKDFDVAKAAGGRNRAVVKEIGGIVAARALTLEFVPKAKAPTDRTAAIISGIEIVSPQ